MNCPSCGSELAAGAPRCPDCDPAVAPVVQGALAADPRLVTPPARPRGRADLAAALLREPAILRRREPREQQEQRDERTWQAEVQERVRSRRQRRVGSGGADLPLFEQPSLSPALPAAAELAARGPSRAGRAAASAAEGQPLRFTDEPAAAEPAAEMQLRPEPQHRSATPSAQAAEAPLSAGLTEAELADLPLRTTMRAAVDNDLFVQEPERPVALPAPPPAPWQARSAASPSADLVVVHSDPDDALELAAPPSEPDPLERPARALERAQAAAFDLALFTALSGVAVYFASRAARVEVLALLESWPWIAAFLGLLAVFYACYFTGTTGQTPGKLLLDLRVVDTGGRRPSYPVATARALLGLLGIALAGLGLLPMAFDPARRAAHDRAFHTRVVRR